MSEPEPPAAGPPARRRSVRGRRLGRYTLLEHLTDGGMAEIFLARLEAGEAGPGVPPPFAKELVLKVLQQRYADNPAVVAMFLEEARLGAVLRHPNIVDVHDVGEDGGVRFIAMEYIEGRTLTDVVTRSLEVGEALPLPHAVHIVAEVAAALAYLDGGLPGRSRLPRIVHRDISPTNVVIGWAGQTKVIDFGIAQQLSEPGQRGRGGKGNAAVKEGEGDGTRPGKVSYMSPEQVRGLPLDPRSDLFSLGTILYEITLGRRLWRGPAELVMRRIVEEPVVPPTYLQRDYPPALERIVLRALEKRPEDRQASAGDMLADLDTFLSDAGMPWTSPRRLGEYLRGIYAPGAKVSAGGARRAQIFQDDDGAIDDPDSAPLDFDRARPGSGAALAHALRSAEPFELAADVTNVTSLPLPGAPPGPGAAAAPHAAPGSPGNQMGTGRTPPPMSLRTPPPISLRSGAGVNTLAPPSALAAPAGVNGASGGRMAAGRADDSIVKSIGSGLAGLGAGRAVLIAVLLLILLGGIFFALRGS